MRAPGPRKRAVRRLRLERLEPRVLLSGHPADNLPTEVLGQQLARQLGTPAANYATSSPNPSGPSQVRSDYGFTGAGQTVAVIDTGIAYDHAALGKGFGPGYRVVAGADFTDDHLATPYDVGPYGGHGTHVAGIIGSSSSTAGGVAPGVDLVALRVVDTLGRGNFGWIDEALQWVHNHRNALTNPITAVNLSLGSAVNSISPADQASLESDLAQLEADGIFISVAAGNNFTGGSQAGLFYPAVSTHVVPVASVDNDGSLSYFSQRDPRALAAPGRSVLSTVPDYLGNGNGVADDFARFSGTSMAAPYVAGASVLLRQAYQFVGVTGVSEQTLYNAMFTTADTVYDPITAQNYRRLNLERAVDAIMPADDFGSTASAAFSLGTLSGSRSVSGAVARLSDQDWFSFTAGASGRVTIGIRATGDLEPRWELAGALPGATTDAGNTMSFDATAGQTYAFGLASAKGLGHYTLDVQLAAQPTSTDWGTVLQGRFAADGITGDGRWFALTASAGGILTVEAFPAGGTENLDLQLFDVQGKFLGAASAALAGQRVDVTVSAGETVRLRVAARDASAVGHVDFRVTNLVWQSGDTIAVAGTGGDDNFTFQAGTIEHLSINGVDYQFDAAAVRRIAFDGHGGQDTAVLHGGGDDAVVLRQGSAELTAPGYQVRLSDVDSITVKTEAGRNRASLYDSAGNNILVAGPGYAGLSGDGFVNRVEGFQTIYAYATAGGHDVAKLYDSPGNDTFVASPRDARLSGRGFYLRAWQFESVLAYSSAGGSDTATLYDSAGNDALDAAPGYARLAGAGFANQAQGFKTVYAYAYYGGHDSASFSGPPAASSFLASAGSATLSGGGFSTIARGFQVARRSNADPLQSAAVDYVLQRAAAQ